MFVNDELYEDIKAVAGEEYNRIIKQYNLCDEDKNKLFIELTSIAAIICYHHKLRSALLKHGIDIEDELISSSDS